MRAPSSLAGLLRHFVLTLRLNFRSKQALAYGFLVPVFFLVAFGSVFRGDTPPLLAEMGQILTISILGGACFGLPTALVAERERGVWRRYRLLPVPMSRLVAGVLAARLMLIASAAGLQVLLARVIYHTPMPLHPGQAVAAFLLVALAFLGFGLVITALADDVPAVQALGQAIFLPMILIGGVGVPLAALPEWARVVAGFLPGRYAVQVLHACYVDPRGLAGSGFALVALTVIGASAACVGAKLFRWDAGRRTGRAALAWVGVALAFWIAVGVTAAITGRSKSASGIVAGYETVTDAQIATINYTDLTGDDELVTRLAPAAGRPDAPPWGPLPGLRSWPPPRNSDPGANVWYLLGVAAVADIAEDLHEGEIARMVFNELQARYDRAHLRRLLAWAILDPASGPLPTEARELERPRHPPPEMIRERGVFYAKKFLGRLEGKLAD